MPPLALNSLNWAYREIIMEEMETEMERETEREKKERERVG